MKCPRCGGGPGDPSCGKTIHETMNAPKPKPGIIVLSDPDADTFHWMSDGWFESNIRHTNRAKQLMQRAKNCIEAAVDVADAERRLAEAGFEVSRAQGGYEEK